MEQYYIMFNYKNLSYDIFIKNLKIILKNNTIDSNILLLKFCIENDINDEYCISHLISNVIYQEENLIDISQNIDKFLSSMVKIHSLFKILTNFIDDDYYKYLLINNIKTEKPTYREIMDKILEELDFLKHENLIHKYTFYVEDQITSLSGYIFNNLSFFEELQDKDFSEGVYKIIKFLYENFQDFNLSFENLYRESGSNLKRLCSHGFCIDIYFEDYYLEESEDEKLTYLSEDL